MRDGEQERLGDIVPDGDVILLVGNENVRLRANSQSLRCASKTFGAMFGPDWREGQGLSKELPAEVALPDDDVGAMRTICCVIHHRNDLAPENPTTKEVLRIAIVVDKYDLKVALKYAILEWLKPRSQPTSVVMEEMGHLLAAAYLLNSSEIFITYTNNLLLTHSGSYLGLMKDDLVSQVLPSEICYLLEEQRTRLRLRLYGIMENCTKQDVCKCGWGKICKNRVGQLLFEYPLVYMLEEPISHVIKRLEGVSTEDIGPDYKYDDGYCGEIRDYHNPATYGEELCGQLRRIETDASITIAFARRVSRFEE